LLKGVVLLQDNKPVVFASKALTDVETRYANIGRIREQTASDSELNTLKEMIHSGWQPSKTQQVPVPLKPNWPFRGELAVEDGITMKSHRIIIPTVLQKEILTKLHAAHQGTEKTKLRARTSVYWRGLNKDIDEITKTCSTCQELQLLEVSICQADTKWTKQKPHSSQNTTTEFQQAGDSQDSKI